MTNKSITPEIVRELKDRHEIPLEGAKIIAMVSTAPGGVIPDNIPPFHRWAMILAINASSFLKEYQAENGQWFIKYFHPDEK